MLCCNRTGVESPQRTRAPNKGGKRNPQNRGRKMKDPDDELIRKDLERLKAAGLTRAPRPILVGGSRVGASKAPAGGFVSLATLPADRNAVPGTLGMANNKDSLMPLPGWQRNTTSNISNQPSQTRLVRETSVTFKPSASGGNHSLDGKENDSEVWSNLGSPVARDQPLPHRVPQMNAAASSTAAISGERSSQGSHTPKVRKARGGLGGTTNSSSSAGDDHFSDTEEATTHSSPDGSFGHGWNSYNQQELEYDGPLEPVILNIYNLIDAEPNDRLAKVGLGLYHTGVELYGMEWSYGEAVEETQVSGIFHVAPRTCMNSIRASVIVGCTKRSPEQVDTILRRLESEWKSVDYHVCNHNCNHFASHFLELLSLGLEKPMELPTWVNRIASGLDYVIPRRLATWFVRKIDGNPPVAVVDPRQGNISALPSSVVPRDWYRAHHLAREPKYSIRLDGRMVEIKEDPAAASSSSGGGASAGTPGLPMASTSVRFQVSTPTSPLHGGREPPSPATLARAHFIPPSIQTPQRSTKAKGHFDPMGGEDSPVFSPPQAQSPHPPSAQPNNDNLPSRSHMGSLSGPAPSEDSYNVPVTDENDAGSTSGDAMPNYAASVREAFNSISHPQPPESPSELSLEPPVSVNKNRGTRSVVTTPTTAPPPLSLLHRSSSANHKESNEADDVDSPSAVPRSRAASSGEDSPLPPFSHPPMSPCPSLRLRDPTSTTVEGGDTGGTLPIVNVSGSIIRLSAIGNMIDLVRTSSSDANLTYSSSQRMTLAAPPRPIPSAVVDPQHEEDVMKGLEGEEDDSSDEE